MWIVDTFLSFPFPRVPSQAGKTPKSDAFQPSTSPLKNGAETVQFFTQNILAVAEMKLLDFLLKLA